MIDPKIGIAMLLEGPYPALWDRAARSETMRFLRVRGGDLSKSDLSKLVRAILAGPERDRHRGMIDEDFNEFRDYSIALRLFKLKVSGAALSERSRKKLDCLLEELQFQPEADDFDEAPRFMPAHWASIDEDTVFMDFASMPIPKFNEWAERQKGRSWDCDGGWREFSSLNPERALELLKQLAEQGSWPIGPWHDALSRFHQEGKKLADCHHRNVALLISEMP